MSLFPRIWYLIILLILCKIFNYRYTSKKDSWYNSNKNNCSGPAPLKHLRYKIRSAILPKISPSHQIILEIHLILESNYKKVISILDNTNPAIIKATFSFPIFVSACKKPVIIQLNSVNSFLRYSQFQSPKTSVITSIFGPSRPLYFLLMWDFIVWHI